MQTEYAIQNLGNIKLFYSPKYNYYFNKKTGKFIRFGETMKQDALFSPYGPEIADIEISVNGCPNNCEFCYKDNTNKPATNMGLETFKTILDKFPPTLTQVALGITGIQTNPNFIPIMECCRSNDVAPNFTLSGIDLTDELADAAGRLAGAIAVSVYQRDKGVAYDAVDALAGRHGHTQVNLHFMLAAETGDFAYEVLNDLLTDKRLLQANAIVFLGLKQKGRATGYHVLDQDKYKKLIEYCIAKKIKFGFDSCSAQKFEYAIRTMTKMKTTQKEKMLLNSEPCESGLFSAYVNIYGVFYPCSFCEGMDNVPKINVLEYDNFMEVWNHPDVEKWRIDLLSLNRTCPVYKL